LVVINPQPFIDKTSTIMMIDNMPVKVLVDSLAAGDRVVFDVDRDAGGRTNQDRPRATAPGGGLRPGVHFATLKRKTAVTEDELIAAIESTREAAHRQCQPYFLQLAAL
jgi:hypothetical protein